MSSTDETQENPLTIVWKNNDSKLLSFDSGESSMHSRSLGSDINGDEAVDDDDDDALDFDDNVFNDDFVDEDNEESDDVNNEKEFEVEMEADDYNDNVVNEKQESSAQVVNSTTGVSLHMMRRARSSPIPIRKNQSRNRRQTYSLSEMSTDSGHAFTPLTTTTITPSLSAPYDSGINCLVGHPPYDCGCKRRHFFGGVNSAPHMTTQQSDVSAAQDSETLPTVPSIILQSSALDVVMSGSSQDSLSSTTEEPPPIGAHRRSRHESTVGGVVSVDHSKPLPDVVVNVDIVEVRLRSSVTSSGGHHHSLARRAVSVSLPIDTDTIRSVGMGLRQISEEFETTATSSTTMLSGSAPGSQGIVANVLASLSLPSRLLSYRFRSHHIRRHNGLNGRPRSLSTNDAQED
ncbi:uncharacterized protein LOC128952261 isoform X2 [Oppia nitens]|nr:uncharacterized protein LOC128952261 isoform X2 [Oppia nitens]